MQINNSACSSTGATGSTGSTGSPIPTTSGSEPYLNIRLPKYLVPIHYDVAINIDLGTGRYNGTSMVTLNITQETSYVYLHTTRMTVQMAKIMSSDGTVLKVGDLS